MAKLYFSTVSRSSMLIWLKLCLIIINIENSCAA